MFESGARRQHDPHVVIVGAGFGGLAAARELVGHPVRVTVIDRHNHHLFQPLLYQVATGGLSGPDIATPIRRVLKDAPNTTVLLGNVDAIDPGQSIVTVDGERIPFDNLIVAAGAHTDYFGHDEWAERAPGLKTIDDALDVRRRLFFAYEAAEREPDPQRQRRWLTFVVVGGGPTGVELAGAIAEIARHTLARDFRNVDPLQTRVILVEGGRLLAGMHPESSAAAKRQLETRGVEVLLDTIVQDVNEHGARTANRFIAANTVIWAAGVKASALGPSLGAPVHKGRVQVQPDLSVPGAPNIYVVGDMMAFQQDGEWLPGVAQVAIQSGRHAARNIAARVEGSPTTPFRYRDKGTMATVGRSAAVAEIGRHRTDGLLAWLIWWVVHIFFLIGFRNRVAVMMEWMWAYLTWQRSARIIIPDARQRRSIHARRDPMPALPQASLPPLRTAQGGPMPQSSPSPSVVSPPVQDEPRRPERAAR